MLSAAVIGVVLFGALFMGLALQLALTGAPPGSRQARSLYHEADGPLWSRLMVNRYTVRGVSRSGDTVAPLALLLYASWLSVRERRWLPVAGVGLALSLALGVLAVGKGVVGEVTGVESLDWHSSALSGPATVVTVVSGMAAWLLRDYLGPGVYRALLCLAGAVTLAVAGTQLYTGHGMGEALASLVCGAGVVAVVLYVLRQPWCAWLAARDMRYLGRRANRDQAGEAPADGDRCSR